jgi:hypothetical protein
MPVVKSVTLTHDQLVEVSQRMHKLYPKESQGHLEWLLFRAISDELSIDLFKLEPDECSCGDKKDPSELMCKKCASYQ